MTLPPAPPITLDGLYALFPDRSDQPTIASLPGDNVPEPYRRLLVHSLHMTVTVEAFYGAPVDVTVLDTQRTGDDYARKILLTLRGSRRVVQFGIVQIDLSLLATEVAERIVEGKTPLGRVLIEHDVLRVVRPIGYFRATPGPTLSGWLGSGETTYGRLGVIYTDGRPAIRVAEILSPITSEVE